MTVPAARNAVWKDGPTEAIRSNAVPVSSGFGFRVSQVFVSYRGPGFGGI
jgi:hypothetical protein